jgi:hypothetical protein
MIAHLETPLLLYTPDFGSFSRDYTLLVKLESDLLKGVWKSV